jgi:nitrogen fixation protein FixH
MKYLVLILFLTSCTKKYECELRLQATIVDSFSGNVTNNDYTWQSEFTGTRKEMKQHEADNTYPIGSNVQGFTTIGQSSMKCR